MVWLGGSDTRSADLTLTCCNIHPELRVVVGAVSFEGDVFPDHPLALYKEHMAATTPVLGHRRLRGPAGAPCDACDWMPPLPARSHLDINGGRAVRASPIA